MLCPHYSYKKPSKTSKAKDHLKALERRQRLWEDGKSPNLWTKVKPYKTDCHQQKSNEYRKTFAKIQAADAKK